jgi:hypothetical protein
MHKLLTGMIITFCVSVKSIYALDITFLPQANDNLTAIESSKNDTKKQTDQARAFAQRQGVSFRDNVAKLQKRFASLAVEPFENRARYSQDHVSPGADYVNDEDFKNLGYDFMQKNIPIPLSQFEQFKVFDVEYEKSVSEEKDVSGNLKKNVPIKTLSAVVKIGRTAFGRPVFNSYASIGFSALERNVFYLDVNNWNSVNLIPHEYQSKMSSAHIKEKISNRIRTSANAGSNAASVEIEEAVFGWNLDQNGNLVPAVIYHGTELGKDGKVISNFCSTDTL